MTGQVGALPSGDDCHPSDDELIELCRNRLLALIGDSCDLPLGMSAEQAARHVAEIVQQNAASGRLHRVRAYLKEEDDVSILQQYVARVATQFSREGTRVRDLEAGDRTEWNRLSRQLTARAYNALLRLGLNSSRAYAEAGDFAQQTCEVILRHEYPYDVPFDAWATRILNNLILQRHSRSREPLDQVNLVQAIDEPSGEDSSAQTFWGAILEDEEALEAFKQVENRETLLQAIRRMRSPAQREVIVRSFFMDWSDEEIAREMGKSKQAVYNLRHRALTKLKEILGKK
jgi:RNA polymerase sigma factor (sigma-70 family)